MHGLLTRTSRPLNGIFSRKASCACMKLVKRLHSRITHRKICWYAALTQPLRSAQAGACGCRTAKLLIAHQPPAVAPMQESGLTFGRLHPLLLVKLQLFRPKFSAAGMLVVVRMDLCVTFKADGYRIF